MAKVAVEENGSAQIERTAIGLTVSVKPKKRMVLMLVLAFWLTFWTFGGVQAIGEFLKPQGDEGHRLFLGFWLCGWLAGELFALFVIAWTFAGRETIELTPRVMIHRREIAGRGIVKEYETRHIKNLRASTNSAFGNMNGLEYWGIGGGTISFDYGVKTFKVVNGIEEAEANRLIHEFQKFIGTGALVA